MQCYAACTNWEAGRCRQRIKSRRRCGLDSRERSKCALSPAVRRNAISSVNIDDQILWLPSCCVVQSPKARSLQPLLLRGRIQSFSVLTSVPAHVGMCANCIKVDYTSIRKNFLTKGSLTFGMRYLAMLLFSHHCLYFILKIDLCISNLNVPSV